MADDAFEDVRRWLRLGRRAEAGVLAASEPETLRPVEVEDVLEMTDELCASRRDWSSRERKLT